MWYQTGPELVVKEGRNGERDPVSVDEMFLRSADTQKFYYTKKLKYKNFKNKIKMNDLR